MNIQTDMRSVCIDIEPECLHARCVDYDDGGDAEKEKM